VDHGEPITQVLLLPGGGTLLTAGSNTCKLWDIIGGGRLVHSFSAHQKLITSLALDGTATRLVSGGLDGLVKVVELGSFTVTAHMRYPSPILSLGLPADNGKLVVGCTDGSLHVKQRAVRMGEVVLERQAAAVLRTGSYRYFLRGGGRGQEATVDDVAPSHDRKPKLKAHDKLLKGFAHGAALDAALSNGVPVVVASVLQELMARHALGQALEGRGEAELQPLTTFLAKYVSHPRYASLCVDVAHTVVDLFAPLVGTSPRLAAVLARLQARLRGELEVGADLLRLQGALDALMAASSSGGGGGAGGRDAPGPLVVDGVEGDSGVWP
jgi:U3 small nucleolar RNA-associated protein 15